MIFKIDTKEKFTVITPQEIDLHDNLTAELAQTAIGELSDETVFYPIIGLILKLKYLDRPDAGKMKEL